MRLLLKWASPFLRESLALVHRRKLAVTMAAAAPRKPEQIAIQELCRGIRNGSSYMAFLLACRIKPSSVSELLGPLGKVATTKAFDAAVDGYRVFEDARRRNLLR